ncbi:MAG: tetratricopeptide repeat protein [Deltaproteobacteria bacterium]|nr:tetratricopeptide repeat protein [Deltaproteobacteria bacterium]
MLRFPFTLAAVALVGCAGQRLAVRADTSSDALQEAGLAQGIPLRDPLELPPDVIAQVVEEVGRDGRPESRAHRVLRWMENHQGNFEYASETFTAGEAFEAKRGDCFAFTNLFIALSRAVGLQVHYVYVREVGRFQERDGSYLVSSHVAAELGTFPDNDIIDFARTPDAHTLYAYRELGDAEAAALFNSNLAVQQLLEGRAHLAERILRFLAEQEPSLPELANNLAVALSRNRQAPEAREVLNAALEQFPRYAPLYTNAMSVALQLGDGVEAQALEARGREVAEDDPLYVFGQGLHRFGDRDYAGAAERFERAAELQESAVAWAWLARAQLAAGKTDASKHALKHALQLAPGDAQIQQLQSELGSL